MTDTKTPTPYKYIDSKDKIITFRNYLKDNEIKIIAVDFEAEFNLHCYGEYLCLIQVFDGKNFYIIDPFKIPDEEIKKTFESKILKLFYGADSDKFLMYRQFLKLLPHLHLTA